MRREIVKDLGIDRNGPPGRHLYKLECGHTVSRRTNLGKTWAVCGQCAYAAIAFESATT